MTISDNEIYVDYHGVESVFQILQEADAAIQQVLNDLQNTIQPLRASWSGASEAEYILVQNRWNNDIGQMNALLTKYGATLNEMSVNYGNTDNRLAMQWSSL